MEVIAQNGQVLLILAIVFGFYMTWGIGANDVANAMGTAVGSGAVTFRHAILIAGVFEFAGVVVAGGSVTDTIRSGIIDPAQLVGTPEVLVFGMLAALLAAAIWLTLASWQGWPVSTSHAIIGGLVGFGAIGIGFNAVHWAQVLRIATSWLVSPLLGGLLGYLLMTSIQMLILRREHPMRMARRWGPLYLFLVGFIVSLVTLFKGLTHLNLSLSPTASVAAALLVGLILAAVGTRMTYRTRYLPEAEMEVQFLGVENAFKPMVVFTACAMAFAHGSNDVANGIGPLAAIADLVRSGELSQESAVPVWILVFGGVGIVVGLVTLGYRVIRTIGTEITTLTPTRAYSATLAAASTVVLASKSGLPVSSTHVAVGAVMGVGLTSGLAAINLRVFRDIAISWVMTLPASALLAIVFFFMFKGIFGVS